MIWTDLDQTSPAGLGCWDGCVKCLHGDETHLRVHCLSKQGDKLLAQSATKSPASKRPRVSVHNWTWPSELMATWTTKNVVKSASGRGDQTASVRQHHPISRISQQLSSATPAIQEANGRLPKSQLPSGFEVSEYYIIILYIYTHAV